MTLIQEATGEETTSIVQQAKETGGELGKATGTVFENVVAFFGSLVSYLISVDFIGNLIAVAVVVALAIVFYKLACSSCRAS
jgi:uncharacterized protein YacL